MYDFPWLSGRSFPFGVVIDHPRSYVDALYCILHTFLAYPLHDVSPPNGSPTTLPRLLVVSAFPFISSGLVFLLLCMISGNGSRSWEIRIALAADIYIWGAGGLHGHKIPSYFIEWTFTVPKIVRKGSNHAKATTYRFRDQSISYLAQDQKILSRTDAQNLDWRLISKAINSQRLGTSYFKCIQFILSGL